MSNLLDLAFTHALTPTADRVLRERVAAHAMDVLASAGGGDRSLIARAEAAVRADPASAFAFDSTGLASLRVGAHTWQAGRFETPSIGELRQRVRARQGTGQARLWVFDGASPATDIGSLQATSGDNTLFQVASQFNCLEAPGPFVTPVTRYLSDPTQGPRAAISAFPATLLRHYAAPGADGARFVQATDGPQIDLLADALGLSVVSNGYLEGDGVANPPAVVEALATRFDAIRVGVHDAAQVALGYNWDGAVAGPEPRLISQAFTSTVAGGGYGGASNLGRDGFTAVARHLLRAAYLGTLLAAVSLGCCRVVLTLIGGGVFGNPMPLIWEAIVWAMDEVTPLVSHDLEVVVNGYNLGSVLDLDAKVLPDVRLRGGAVLRFDRDGLVSVER